MFKNIKSVRDSFIDRFKGSLEYYEDYADATTKKIADKTIKNFTEGIINDSFGLKRLKQSTIDQKRRKGYPSPETPLYGKGGDRSYSEMLIIRKLKNGHYRIRASAKYHHSMKVKLNTLFFVHEYGAAIDNGKAIIFIPPRPAFKRATMQIMLGEVNFKELKQTLYKFWNKGVNDFKSLVKK
jgi:hypothetical protein